MRISVGCGNYEDTIRQQQVLNFFFCRQPVEVVKEKERGKRREREGESQKSNFFFGFREI